MSVEAEQKCALCAFWKMARPNEGSCQRRAPPPAYISDCVAHWPTTHGGQGCGEFLARDAALEPVVCAACHYWRRPPTGLEPADRADKTAQWWGNAGLCVRLAPAPQSEPGPRAFWRASHATDLCAEARRKQAC